MSSPGEGGGSRRRKQSAPKRVVRFDDDGEANNVHPTQDVPSSSSTGSARTLHEANEPQLLGHAAHEEEDADERYNSESYFGWHVPSLVEGREPRKKKARTVKSRAERRREELAQKGMAPWQRCFRVCDSLNLQNYSGGHENV